MTTMKWELLHLTDIHFGDVYIDETKQAVPAPTRENLRPRVERMLRAYQEEGMPHALVITGDITIAGNEEALSTGAEAFRPFAQSMVGDKRIVAIVPGNHDVKWGLRASAPGLFDDKFRDFRQRVVEYVHGVRTCALPIGGTEGDLKFLKGKPSPVVVDHDNQLVVICINSAIRCGELNEVLLSEAEALVTKSRASNADDLLKWMRKRCVFDIAHVTEPQRDLLRQELIAAKTETEKRKKEWAKYLRVAILHHHLIGVSQLAIEHKPFELTVDAPQVLTLLAEHDVQLVLTGHKHHPYAQRHLVRLADGRERSIVVAGGATVLGGLPIHTAVPRGFNRVEVTCNDNGDMRYDFCVLDIGSEEETFRAALKLSKEDPTRVQWHRRVDVSRVRPDLPLVAQPSSAPVVPRPCEAKTLDQVDLASNPTDDFNDQSDEWMIWLNVQGCHAAASAARDMIAMYERDIRYASLYHLYGSYDLLVRVNLKTGESRHVVEAILDGIKSAGQIVGPDQPEVVNVKRVEYVHPERKHRAWNQAEYEATRTQRAFLIGRNKARAIPEIDLKRAIREAKEHCTPFPGSWSIHFADKIFVLEAEIACGRYYDLQVITKAYEKWLDYHPYTKQTHLAYVHEEWRP